MKKTRLELDSSLYAAWAEDESAFLTSTVGRYRATVRGPGGTEVTLGFDHDDLQQIVERSFFSGAAHLACRPEEVDVLEIVNRDDVRVWQGRGWENPFRFRSNAAVDLGRRQTLQASLAGGLGLMLAQSLVKNDARAGTTTTNLSGTASGFIPMPQLWYKNGSISSLSDGAAITTWPNSGDWGASYNLVSGGTGSAPAKATDSGFAAAFFNGGHGLVFASSNAITFLQTSAFKNWTIFAVYRDSNGSGNFGFLSRYQADSTNGSVGMWPNGNSNKFSQIHTNDGFPLMIDMPDDGSINLTAIRWGLPSSVDGTVTYWRGKTGAASTTSWAAYLSDLIVKGIGATRTQWNVGYMYELLVYDSALSDAQVNEVRNYLAGRFPGSPVAT